MAPRGPRSGRPLASPSLLGSTARRHTTGLGDMGTWGHGTLQMGLRAMGQSPVGEPGVLLAADEPPGDRRARGPAVALAGRRGRERTRANDRKVVRAVRYKAANAQRPPRARPGGVRCVSLGCALTAQGGRTREAPPSSRGQIRKQESRKHLPERPRTRPSQQAAALARPLTRLLLRRRHVTHTHPAACPVQVGAVAVVAYIAPSWSLSVCLFVLPRLSSPASRYLLRPVRIRSFCLSLLLSCLATLSISRSASAHASPLRPTQACTSPSSPRPSPPPLPPPGPA